MLNKVKTSELPTNSKRKVLFVREAEQEALEPSESEQDATDVKDVEEESSSEAKEPAKVETKEDKEKQVLLRETMARKEEIKSLKQQAKEREEKAAEMAKKLKEFEEKQSAEELAKLEEEKDFDGVKQRIIEQAKLEKEAAVNEVTSTLSEKIESLQEALNEQESHLKTLVFDAEFGKASDYLNKETVLTTSIAKRAYSGYMEIQDGKAVWYDAPKGSEKRTALVGADGNSVSAVEALKEIINKDPDNDSIIRSKIVPGSGSDTQKSGKVIDKSKSKLTGRERILHALRDDAKRQ